MIKAMIFDIGGVIQGLDWSPVVNSLLDLKKNLDIGKYKAALYYDRKNYFDLYATGNMGKEDFWGMVSSRLGINKKYLSRLSESFQLLYSFINYDLLELIKKLKYNYKLIVLSNACPEIEHKVIKDDLYVHLFDQFYFSHNINSKKPNKEAYLKVTGDNNLKPEECLFIDNDMVNIKGAENIGMNTVLYKDTDSLKKEIFSHLTKEKKSNKIIVGFTTGVFDLFHAGHLNLLKNAKKYCDKLIVGITSDELAINFKGKKPFMSYKERFDIVNSIRYVDMVVPQENMDKFEAWEKYKFDVMFTSTKPTKKWPKVEVEFIRKFKKNKISPPRIIKLPYTHGVSSSMRKKTIV